ncbi:MAG: hypothetical protein NUW01_18670 [Gemmatimonadaceae bacterium]|nr:hypothetical protein [Gemmatimonadaceae bacterium]
MTDHTPTPWTAMFHETARQWYVDAGRRQFCLRTTSEAFPRDELDADAEFIVRAVNAYDDLLAALGVAEAALAVAASYRDTDQARINAALSDVRFAINEARGEAVRS